MSKQLIGFIDVDSVCADLGTAWLNRYNKDYGDTLTSTDIKSWKTDQYVKLECGKHIYDYLSDPSLYDEVQPIPGALKGVLNLLNLGFDIRFATSTPNGSAGRKFRWLVDQGFLTRWETKQYIEINDKSLLRGDFMVDDSIHNLDNFEGYGILFRQPHNMNVDWPVIAKDWDDVVSFLMAEDIPVGVHPTELKSPRQARAFKELVKKMYEVHLGKNQDYSPANILGVGEPGLATRLWDKTIRLMNLVGFNVDAKLIGYQEPKTPCNESIDDNVMDAAVYSVIWNLYRKGSWGN